MRSSARSWEASSRVAARPHRDRSYGLCRALVALLVGFTGLGGPVSGEPKPARPEVILATTTSTQDSGLLDVLLPAFGEQTGYTVKPIAVGSGQAMALGERGEADVLLVHAPDSERKFMKSGHGTVRKLVMHNDFILVGPPADPVKAKRAASALGALKKVAGSNALFLSRGDKSGTHQLEQKLWKQAGLETKGRPWYQESGQGMGATLAIASEKNAYTITDRATYLALKKNLALDVLVQGDKALMNIYHVIQVDPKKSARINSQGAGAFVDFMVAPATQQRIKTFGVEKYGQPLFVPDAGEAEADLGR
ncbi:MAG: substrate-binding domain-containing protein [Candidatus Riflebacteria bacterium]|nr:substrate-binding domain-containing protein [Candidatus Riflebacteria bacterium]